MSPVELKTLILAMTAYYGQQIPDEVIAMYAEDLSDLPIEAVRHAMSELRRDPKVTRFPLPAVIRDRIQPADTDEMNAQEAVSRVIQAVGRFGWTNGPAAREFVGDLGWKIVERDGGWQTVCQSLNEENLGVYRAQWKGLALTLLRRAKLGLVDGPSLPVGPGGGLQPLFGSVLKQLDEGGKK